MEEKPDRFITCGFLFPTCQLPMSIVSECVMSNRRLASAAPSVFATIGLSENMKQSNQNPAEHRVAYFISPHGFGHAARAAGVMEAIHDIEPSIRFEIFTKVPSWFLEDSLSLPFGYHSLLTDIGMVQESPLKEDLGKTIKRLNDFLPFEPSMIRQLAKQLEALQCELVLCDIAPMGILVALEASLPSVLVENFTWDWIYEGYASCDEQIGNHVDYLKPLFNSASHHIQTEPACLYRDVDLLTPPVSRKSRITPERIRRELHIPVEKKVVLVTMRGIQVEHSFLKKLESQPDVCFVITGGSQSMEWTDNIVILHSQSKFFHPDLVNASDAVVGKLGYSTLAEVYHAGVPFGYVSRATFRESGTLARYVEKEMPCMTIEEADFQEGDWVSDLPGLLTLQRKPRRSPNGSEQIANYICSLLGGVLDPKSIKPPALLVRT